MHDLHAPLLCFLVSHLVVKPSYLLSTSGICQDNDIEMLTWASVSLLCFIVPHQWLVGPTCLRWVPMEVNMELTYHSAVAQCGSHQIHSQWHGLSCPGGLAY